MPDIMTAPKSLTPRRFSVHEYYDMARVGILGADERVELLDGQVVRMTPMGSRHAACVSVLNRLFSNQIPDSVELRVQLPLRLHSFSEPEPDLVLLKARPDGYWDGHPGPEDTLLVVEVSESSLQRDRGAKLAMYAEAGVPEVWIVDISGRHLEVFRTPEAGRYTAVARLGRAEVAAPELVPAVRIPVQEVVR